MIDTPFRHSSRLAASLIACGSLASAQAGLEELLRTAPAALPDGAPAAMANIDRVELARHAYYLASDALGGRHTGTAGQRATAAYVTERFRSAGLAPLGDPEGGEPAGKGQRRYLQQYSVARTHLDPDKTFFELGSKRWDSGFGVTLAKTDSVDVTGRLRFCGRGKRNELPEQFAEGDVPVVLLTGRQIPAGAGPEMQFMMGFREMARVGGIAKRARKRGAKTLLVLDWNNGLGDIVQYAGVVPGKPDLTYGSEVGMSGMLAGHRTKNPTVVVGRPLAEDILAQLGVTVDADGHPIVASEPRSVQARVAVLVAKQGNHPCSNVVAWLEGSDPQLKREAIVFSAHMDHMGTRLDGDVFNGADDNASGTSGLLEIAQAFALGERPRRSVIFLSVSGEELGLWGSAHFADHPTWPIENIVANINIDMIGRSTQLSDEQQISVTPSYRHPNFSSIARDSAKLGAALGMTFTNGDTYYERSDHYNFAKKGIPVIFYCDGEHPDYHQVTDTADKLDYAKMERVARLAFWTGWNVAQQDDRPIELGSCKDWSGAAN